MSCRLDLISSWSIRFVRGSGRRRASLWRFSLLELTPSPAPTPPMPSPLFPPTQKGRGIGITAKLLLTTNVILGLQGSRIELRNLRRLSRNHGPCEDELRAGGPCICETSQASKKALFNNVAKGPIANRGWFTYSVRIIQTHNATPLLMSEVSLGVTPARLAKGCLSAWHRNVDCYAICAPVIVERLKECEEAAFPVRRHAISLSTATTIAPLPREIPTLPG